MHDMCIPDFIEKGLWRRHVFLHWTAGEVLPRRQCRQRKKPRAMLSFRQYGRPYQSGHADSTAWRDGHGHGEPHSARQLWAIQREYALNAFAVGQLANCEGRVHTSALASNATLQKPESAHVYLRQLSPRHGQCRQARILECALCQRLFHLLLANAFNDIHRLFLVYDRYGGRVRLPFIHPEPCHPKWAIPLCVIRSDSRLSR